MTKKNGNTCESWVLSQRAANENFVMTKKTENGGFRCGELFHFFFSFHFAPFF